MTFYVENNTSFIYDLALGEKVKNVISKTVEQEHFIYDFELNLRITNNEGIKKYNSTFRKIDKETDVLSFPNLDFKNPGEYFCLEDPVNKINYMNPDTNEVLLGDIILSYEKVIEQANVYGHSITREFCFLIAHSMLHLLGYDHIEHEDAKVMEFKQEKILELLGITKDIL
jgi:probable rRNA maturation factor